MGLGWIRTLDEVQKFGADGAVRAVRVDALLVVVSENVSAIAVPENMVIYEEERSRLWIGYPLDVCNILEDRDLQTLVGRTEFEM